ncbi:site-specific DNA recombinase [Agrococcus sp. UYP10]|uniref:recombinase family protein n=1 Tax=Agrococcus sp. UYP10 TaxID=1756355 RepID=UPI00339394A5
MTTYIYARQSVNHAEGIDRQVARCQALCAAKEWEVQAVFTDNAVSATKRRGLGTSWVQLLAVMQRGDVVVAVDVDRLLRSLEDLVDLQRLGVRVLTVDGEIDTTTADGEFRASMLASIARFETRRKRERTLRANNARGVQGKPSPSRRRYGYESDGVTPVSEEAEVVRRIFDAFLAGASIRSITRGLQADGIEPTTGTGWSTRRIRDTLSNVRYGGAIEHEGEVIPSPVIVPIVEPERAAEARALLADESRRTTPGPGVRHLLSGIASCGVCSSSMFFMRDYRCRADTTHPSIQKRLLDPRVESEVVNALLLGGGRIDALDEDAAAIGPLTASLARIEAETQRVVDERSEGLLSPAVARLALLRWKAEREEVEAKLDQARERSAIARLLLDLRLRLAPDSRIDMDEAVRVKREIRSRWEALDLDTQRTIVRALVTVTVHPGRKAERVVIENR